MTVVWVLMVGYDVRMLPAVVPGVDAQEYREDHPGEEAHRGKQVLAGQKNSTPRRNPTNSGGLPSGVSAPPMLATRNMANTSTCAL